MSQVWNCDGVVLKILIDQKIQWPQEGLNYEPLSLVGQVTALHVRGLQFKPSCGHWNLWSIKISSTTPPQIKKLLKSQEPTITVGQLSNQWTRSKQGFAKGVLDVGFFTDFVTDFINILISVTWPFQKLASYWLHICENQSLDQ